VAIDFTKKNIGFAAMLIATFSCMASQYHYQLHRSDYHPNAYSAAR